MPTPPEVSQTVADADAQFMEWMRRNLANAADHFGVRVIGRPVYGWRLRSIGARAASAHGPRWLRVVSEFPQWTHGDFWTGNLDANTIPGISKPEVLDSFEWSEGEWRRQRAEISTILTGTACSSSDVLREDPQLPDEWWQSLRHAVYRLRATPTTRVSTDETKIQGRVRQAFAGDFAVEVNTWETVHGDLHWANLHRDGFGILDWESWGRGPAGLDPATLYCYSLLVPPIAARVREVFADMLNTPAGRTAQIAAAARLLVRATDGDFPDLVTPLRRHIATLAG